MALRAGAREEAARGFEEAARGFDERNMALYAAASRERLVRLRGGSASELKAASAPFRAEGVVAPDRMIAMFVPGTLP
jgi:hypothetical protein